jgi:hypothetical protein
MLVVLILVLRRSLFSSIFYVMTLLSMFIGSVFALIFFAISMTGVPMNPFPNPMLVFVLVIPFVIALFFALVTVFTFVGIVLKLHDALFEGRKLFKVVVLVGAIIVCCGLVGGFGFCLWRFLMRDLRVGDTFVFALYLCLLVTSIFFLCYGLVVRARLLASPDLSEEARRSVWRLVVCPVVSVLALLVGVIFKGLIAFSNTVSVPE